MNNKELVAVSSRSFSKSQILRHELQKHFLQVKFNETGAQLTDNDLVEFLAGASYAIIGLETINDSLLRALPNLRAICKMGTGVDKINFDALKKNGIVFAHTPGLNKRSVSELVVALMLSMMRYLPKVTSDLKTGVWQQIKGRQISNKTVGIIGCGAIGQDLAYLLQSFGCRCLAYDINQPQCLKPYIERVDLDILLRQSDIISIHLPLTDENYHIIGKDELNKMKEGSILINTARGGLIDEMALYESLRNGHLSGAALDVFEMEPHIPYQLMEFENFIATPHIGGSTEEAIQAMGIEAIKSIINLETELSHSF